MSEPDKEKISERLAENIKEQSTWIRGFFMLVFLVIYGVSKAVLIAVVIFQFVSRLLTRQTNSRLQVFSVSLVAYLYQIALYLTYNSEEQPFPFGEWPRADVLGGAAVGAGRAARARSKKSAGAKSSAAGGKASTAGETKSGEQGKSKS